MRRLGYLLMVLWLVPLSLRADTVSVFAAASLGPVLQDIAKPFTASTGHQVIIAAAGSSTLARQIENGAPADVYISANTAWVDYIETRGLVVSGARGVIAKNELVAISGQTPSNAVDPFDISENEFIAMALVDAVPAGIYGKEALIEINQWERLRERVVQTDNVRAALQLVALGEARLGIVYATDALSEPRVRIVYRFATDSHAPIEYTAAQVSRTKAAAEFFDFLRTQSAQDIFVAHGFLPIVGQN